MKVHEAIAVVALSGGVVVSVPSAGAAEFRLVPSLALAEEFNDNLHEVPRGGEWELITRVQPSLAVAVQGTRFTSDLSYGLDYRKFARGTAEDEINHAAAVNSKLMFWNGLLQIDANDTYSRVSLDVARNTVAESLVVNQTEQNTFYLSPYLSLQRNGRELFRGGYRFSQTTYFNASAVDRTEQQAFAEFSRDLTASLTISQGYSFVHGSAEAQSYNRHDLYGGFRYVFGEGNTLFGRIGNSWQSFSGEETTASNLIWDAGASRDFGFVVATVRANVQYAQDPMNLSMKQTSYSAGLTRSFRRGDASLSATYSEYEAEQSVPQERRYQTGVGATGRYELSPYTVVLLGLSGDHISQAEGTGTDYPYHLYGSFSIDHAMSSHIALRFDYSHLSYRDSLGSSTGSTEVNRCILMTRILF